MKRKIRAYIVKFTLKTDAAVPLLAIKTPYFIISQIDGTRGLQRFNVEVVKLEVKRA